MPAVVELSKERIVKVAVKIVNDKGWESVNARSLASALGVSTKPLYRIYNNMDEIKEDIYKIVLFHFKDAEIEIFVNTRDNYENNDMYMTLIGSAVESGDEGAVWRGNRSRGVIPFCRNFSMEAPCGKNPVYHTGKLFTAIGDKISKDIYDKYNIENVVYCTSKMGDNIEEPWNVSIELNTTTTTEIKEEINSIVQEQIKNHYKITEKIISQEIKVNSY